MSAHFEEELNRLAGFLRKNVPDEISKDTDETAVDIAIRLLGQLKKCEDCRGIELMIMHPVPGVDVDSEF